MSINIYKDQLLEAELLGRPVLYTTQTIPREEVPESWYCYDLRGTIRHPDEPYVLLDHAKECHVGSVLSPVPLKRESTLARQVEGQFFLNGRLLTLSEFCQEQGLSQTQGPRKYIPRPASPEDTEIFYTYETPEKYTELGTIGQLRFDFGYFPGQLCRTWWRRTSEDMRSPEFKEELERVVGYFRQGALKSLDDMKRWCEDHGGALKGGREQNYGYMVETERYQYCLRCSPMDNVYQAYLTCFDKQMQKQAFGLTEKGRQTLQEDALQQALEADPAEGCSMTMGGM